MPETPVAAADRPADIHAQTINQTYVEGIVNEEWWQVTFGCAYLVLESPPDCGRRPIVWQH
ncbi:MAG: hypothetical protein R3C19_22530 [Planctomycetaceae bacterium]